MPRCDVLTPTGRCAQTDHTVTRPTRGGPYGLLCYGHQQALARGERLWRKSGHEYFLPLASRTRARIMRGG